MHFVLLNQFYPPSVLPTGVMLEAVASGLAARGHQVSVVCGGGSVGEAGGNPVKVRRLGALSHGKPSFIAKLAGYASFYAGVFWTLLWMKPRPDVIVALTTPPFLSLLARLAAWRHGGKHAHWIMDLYPDVMVAHGMLREGGIVNKLLVAVARWGMGGKRRALVMALGPDMAERSSRYLPAGQSAEWVPLWGTAAEPCEAGAVADLRPQRGWTPEEVVFLYSGNMGLGHRFSEVYAAAPLLCQEEPERNIRLAFYGGGKRMVEVEKALAQMKALGIPQLSAEIHGYVASAQLAEHLASGDVHLASLEPAWDGMMVPSKLQGIFAAGRPVLFTGSRTCSIGQWILASGGGWVCAPGDVAAHVLAMQEALDPDERAKKGAAARRFAGEWFDRGKNVERIVDRLIGQPVETLHGPSFSRLG